MTPTSRRLERSRALWNRSRLDLRSDEVLAQILDRGDLDDWRELYRLAAEDASLRRRILRVSTTAPIAMPHLFIARWPPSARRRNPIPSPTPRPTGSDTAPRAP